MTKAAIREAWRRCLEEMMSLEDAAAIAADSDVDELVFHEIAAIDARRFRVTLFAHGRHVGTLYRRTETDAIASGIAMSCKIARTS